MVWILVISIKKVFRAKFSDLLLKFSLGQFCVFTGVFFDFIYGHLFGFHVCFSEFFNRQNPNFTCTYECVSSFLLAVFFKCPKSGKSLKFSRVSFFLSQSHTRKKKQASPAKYPFHLPLFTESHFLSLVILSSHLPYFTESLSFTAICYISLNI